MALDEINWESPESEEEMKKFLNQLRAELAVSVDDINNAHSYLGRAAKHNRNTYGRVLKLVSHPAALVRIRIVPDAEKLLIKANRVIRLNRAVSWGGILAGLIGIVTGRGYLSIVGLTLIAFWFFFLNRIQTRLNLELAARLLAVDAKLAARSGITIDYDSYD